MCVHIYVCVCIQTYICERLRVCKILVAATSKYQWLARILYFSLINMWAKGWLCELGKSGHRMFLLLQVLCTLKLFPTKRSVKVLYFLTKNFWTPILLSFVVVRCYICISLYGQAFLHFSVSLHPASEKWSVDCSVMSNSLLSHGL